MRRPDCRDDIVGPRALLDHCINGRLDHAAKRAAPAGMRRADDPLPRIGGKEPARNRR